MQFRSHGGQCCGIVHIYNMEWPGGNDGHANALNLLNKKITEVLSRRYGVVNGRAYWGSKPWNCLIEVVINRYQYVKWAPVLVERGFKLVTTFDNSNSGGTTCFVFHLQTASKKEK